MPVFSKQFILNILFVMMILVALFSIMRSVLGVYYEKAYTDRYTNDVLNREPVFTQPPVSDYVVIPVYDNESGRFVPGYIIIG